MSKEPYDRKMAVTVVDERTLPLMGPTVDTKRWQRLAQEVLFSETLIDGPLELGVHFVDEEKMADLKRQHLDGDGRPTDVLAFPIDGLTDPIPGQPILLGDVLICPSVAERQAGATYEDELALLLVHGILHLLGHDHIESHETEEMKAREEYLLNCHYREWSTN